MTKKKALAQQLKANKPEAAYPPRILRCKIKELPDAPSYLVVAEFLKIAPITAIRLLQGTEVKLSQALKLAKLLGKPIEQLWEEKA